MTQQDREARMRALTRRAHAGQTRNGGRIPYWVHTDGVAAWCRQALARGGELPPEHGADVVLAGYGHDLYEDTDVTDDEVRAGFGDRVAGLVAGMTNRVGDHDRRDYLASLATSPDEVRLIKCADVADNVLSVAYGLHDVGLDWAHGFFLPIAAETRDLLHGVPFTRLTRSGPHLLDLVESAWTRLEAALETADGQAWAVVAPSGTREGLAPPA